MTAAELLARRAYEQGFAAGADPLRARRRHAVEPDTHEHWRRGFEDGRQAVTQASRVYMTARKAGT